MGKMKPKTNSLQATRAAEQISRSYEPPSLFEYGSIRQFTNSTSLGSMSDAGIVPKNMKTCIATLSSIDEHRFLIGDETCQNLFRKAILNTVKKDDVVLDLGTGTGLHAFFALQAGAKKVYALDALPIIEVAKQVASANGFADKIEFIYGEAAEVQLPERVDVIITNIGFLNTLESMPDAIRRFLKPGGKTIPATIDLSFVPVEVEPLYQQKVDFWSEKRFGLDFSALRPFAAEHPQVSHCQPADFIAEPSLMQRFALGQEALNFASVAKYTVKRDATFSGLLGWYEMHLAENVVLSTKPPLKIAPEIWTQPFLPLIKPIAVRRGEVIELDLKVYLKASLEGPVWAWKVKVGERRREQNSFNAIPLSKELLKKLAVN